MKSNTWPPPLKLAAIGRARRSPRLGGRWPGRGGHARHRRQAATSSNTATEISTAHNGKLGTILVAGNNAVTDSEGRQDLHRSALKTRPGPVLLPAGVGAATAGTGVDAAKLGTVKTFDGSLQITYAGKPLYWSAKDKTSGQVHAGHNKYGTWTAVVTAKSDSGTKSPSTTDTGNGGVGS